ncbi:MAG: hypothetical protein ACREGK_05205 [Geminicoccales bacterium]
MHTGYRFAAPNRMAYRTSAGGRLIAIGKHSYSREPGGWEKQGFGAGGGFKLDDITRWTLFARAVRWLGRGTEQGRPVVRVAVLDQDTPIWYRLAIERRSSVVLAERMIAPGHYMSRRYFAFNRPLEIEAPRSVLRLRPRSWPQR